MYGVEEGRQPYIKIQHSHQGKMPSTVGFALGAFRRAGKPRLYGGQVAHRYGWRVVTSKQTSRVKSRMSNRPSASAIGAQDSRPFNGLLLPSS
jgi:hypothetical protein